MAVDIQGGEKLDKILSDLQEKAGSKAGLNIGILEGATNSDGVSIAFYGMLQEYGWKYAAPKPFLRTTANAKAKDWVKQIAHLIKGDFDFISALQVVGDIASKDVQDTIQTWPNDPPNKETTNKRKMAEGYGSQNLVHKGDMLRSISFEVVE